MSLADDLSILVRPQAGETIRDALSNVPFNVVSGSATESTVESNPAYLLAEGTLIEVPIPTPMDISSNDDAGGITIAMMVRFNSVNLGSRPEIMGVTTAAGNLISGLFIGGENNTKLRSRHATALTTNINGAISIGSISTVVVRLDCSSTASDDYIRAWVGQDSRVGTDPDDATGSGGNSTDRTGIINFYINCPAGMTMDILGAAAFNGEGTDAELAALADDFITVTDAMLDGGNTAPVANAGADQGPVAAGSTVTLDGTGSSDADTDTLTYLWAQTAGDTVTLSSTTAAQPTFTAPSTGSPQTLTFSLIVNDGTENSAADFVDVAVAAQGQPEGTISGKLRNNTLTPRANLSGVTVDIYSVSTGALIVRKTNVSTDANGDFSVTDPLIVTGTEYRLVVTLGAADGVGRETAT